MEKLHRLSAGVQLASPFEAELPFFLSGEGHAQLFVRGVIAGLQCCVTCILVGADVARTHTTVVAFCQLVSSATLVTQYREARRARVCFLLRGLASLVRAVVVAHLAACGREAEWARPESWDGCDAGPWRGDDPRLALRAIHVFAAARLLANGSSLLAQRATPGARAATCGHPQLRLRSRIRATGVPIHLLRGALKLALLRGTRYNRGDLEVACNFARLPLICTAAWSLDRQFRSSGTAAARSGHVELPKAAVVPDSRGSEAGT